jgi:BirA family biotin operon repressor/biotin-[acetyl-CoA-carboxylase] ligase
VASSVTLSAGVAVAEAIRQVSGLQVEIKWPNDLHVERRKLCGILAEASAAASGLDHVVLGIGINLRAATYPPGLTGRATSIEEELGRPVDEHVLLAEVLARFSETVSRLPGEGLETVLRRWRELSPSASGARVEVLTEAGRWERGTTAGIDDDGALLVDRAGSIHRVIAGEVRWL